MITINEHDRIYLAIQAFDFRKGIDGFAALCRQQFSKEPTRGHCFIFRNRRKTAIKVLLYDGTGFWLCHKRLSKGQFKNWPKTADSLVRINPFALMHLLQQ